MGTGHQRDQAHDQRVALIALDLQEKELGIEFNNMGIEFITYQR